MWILFEKNQKERYQIVSKESQVNGQNEKHKYINAQTPNLKTLETTRRWQHIGKKSTLDKVRWWTLTDLITRW